MVCDRIERLELYRGLNSNLDRLIELLPGLCLEDMPDGRQSLQGDALILNLIIASLKSESAWEAHREYIDLQLILQNEETIAWAPVDDIRDFSEYDPAGDVMTSEDISPGTAVRLCPGMFMLLFPHDAHRTGIGSGEGRKAVFKIMAAEHAEMREEIVSPLRHLGTQELMTRRLQLRRYRVEDAEAMFNHWAGDPEVTKTLQWPTHENAEQTRELLRGWVKAYEGGQLYHWAIEEGGGLIGDISVVRWSDSRLDCEIGYCLSRRHWNRGIMTEALKKVMSFLFIQVGFRRIILRHDVINPASGRVMQKAGLKAEGCHRQEIRRKDGSYADIIQYAALKDEWLKEQGITAQE